MNVHKLFLDFDAKIRLTDSKTKKLKSNRRILRKKIRAYFKEQKWETPYFYSQGSFPIKTNLNPIKKTTDDGSIKEEYDLDDGVYFICSESERKTTDAYHYRIKKAVEEHNIESVIDKKWHHIVMVFDRPTVGQKYCYVYIDGNKDQTTDISSIGNVNSTVQFTVGISFSVLGYKYYIGTIDEVRVYNRAISWAWVNATYRNVNNSDTFLSFGLQEPVARFFPDDSSLSTTFHVPGYPTNNAYKVTSTFNYVVTSWKLAAGLDPSKLTPFTSDDYNQTLKDDDVYQESQTPSSGTSGMKFPTRFIFNISGISINNINKIEYLWGGYSTSSTGKRLYYYDENDPDSYTFWSNFTTSDADYYLCVNSDFDKYIGNTNMINFSVIIDKLVQKFWTDYDYMDRWRKMLK